MNRRKFLKYLGLAPAAAVAATAEAKQRVEMPSPYSESNDDRVQMNLNTHEFEWRSGPCRYVVTGDLYDSQLNFSPEQIDRIAKRINRDSEALLERMRERLYR